MQTDLNDTNLQMLNVFWVINQLRICGIVVSART